MTDFSPWARALGSALMVDRATRGLARAVLVGAPKRHVTLRGARTPPNLLHRAERGDLATDGVRQIHQPRHRLERDGFSGPVRLNACAALRRSVRLGGQVDCIAGRAVLERVGEADDLRSDVDEYLRKDSQVGVVGRIVGPQRVDAARP